MILTYYIIYFTRPPGTEEAVLLLEENPGDYVIDSVVHNEIIFTSTMRYLERKHGVKGVYSARKWLKKYGYPEEVINAIRELIT